MHNAFVIQVPKTGESVTQKYAHTLHKNMLEDKGSYTTTTDLEPDLFLPRRSVLPTFCRTPRTDSILQTLESMTFGPKPSTAAPGISAPSSILSRPQFHSWRLHFRPTKNQRGSNTNSSIEVNVLPLSGNAKYLVAMTEQEYQDWVGRKVVDQVGAKKDDEQDDGEEAVHLGSKEAAIVGQDVNGLSNVKHERDVEKTYDE